MSHLNLSLFSSPLHFHSRYYLTRQFLIQVNSIPNFSLSYPLPYTYLTSAQLHILSNIINKSHSLLPFLSLLSSPLPFPSFPLISLSSSRSCCFIYHRALPHPSLFICSIFKCISGILHI